MNFIPVQTFFRMNGNLTWNSTETNATNTGLSLQDSGRIWLIVPLICLVIVTISGNIIVMMCVRIDKRLASQISSIYVFSLAGADLIVGIFVMGGMCVYTMYGLWPIGHLLCTIWVAFDFTCCTVSMLHLCLIAFDRYEAVVHPIDYKNNHTSKVATMRSIGAWILGFLAWLPAIISFRAISPGPDNDCFFIPEKLYILIQSIVVYYSPIFIMVIFYIGCLMVLRKRYIKTVASSKDGPKLFMPTDVSTTGGSNATDVSTISATSAHREEAPNPQLVAAAQAKLSKQQQQLRSIRTLGVVMAMFLFCWLPFCLFWPITAYCPECISLRLYEYSYWAAYLNSTINPFLYFLSNRDFRNAFKTMIGKKE